MSLKGGIWTRLMASGWAWCLVFLLLSGALAARELPDSVAWRWEFDRNVMCSPVQVGSVLVVATEERIWGIDAETGRELWKTEFSTRLVPDSPSLTHEGLAIFLTRDGLLALDGRTGQERWNVSATKLAPRLCLGRLIIVGKNGELQALDPSTGQSRWRTGDESFQAVAVDGPRILAASNQQVCLWDLSQGSKLWSHKLDNPDRPALGAVALALEENLTAWDPATGKKLWSLPNVEHYALSGDQVIAQAGSELVGLSARTGQKLWKDTSYSEEIQTIGSGLILVQGYQGISLLDQRSGKRLRHLNGTLPGTLRGNELLVAGTEGHVYRLDASNGKFLPGYRDLFTPSGESLARPGLVSGKRTYLPVGSTLLALGEGPGTVELKGTPELHLSVDSPVTPGKVVVSVEGKFVRRPEIRLYREQAPGKRVLSKTLPVIAGASGFFDRVELKGVKPGNYMVEAVSGEARSRAELTVTRMGVLIKVAPGQFLLRAIDAVQGSPLAGVLVEMSKLGEALEPGLSGVTDAQGLLRIDTALPLDQPAKLRLRRGEEDVSFSWTPQPFPGNQKIFLQTDRSLYRPNHEVFFQGLIGSPDGEKSRLVKEALVTVEIRDSADNALTTQELTSDEFGAFSGSLKLGAEPPLGRYQLSAWLDPKQPASLPFEVQEYRKPPFEVNVKARERMVSAGRALPFDLVAKTFFGAPVSNAKVKVTVRRAELSGRPTASSPGYHSYADFVSEQTLTLGPDGKATFEVPTEKGKKDAEYLVDAEVTGPSGQVVEGSGSGLAMVGTYGIYLRADGWVAYPGKPVRVAVETLDRLGQPVPAQVKIRVESPWSKKALLAEPVVKTGASGKGELVWTPGEKDGSKLVFTAQGVGQEPQEVSFYLYAPNIAEANLQRSLSAEKKELKAGETARLLLSARQECPALLTLEGRKLFLARPFTAKKGAQILEFPVEARFAPGLTATVSLREDGTSVVEKVDLVIPDTEHRLSLKVEAEQPKYRPGETAHLRLSATNAKGEPVDAVASLSVVDEALLALSGDQVPAIHKFFFGPAANRVQTYLMQPRRSEVAGFQTVPAPTQVRKDFKDTAFWKPDVLIKDGKAEVAVPLPDNLTRWRATSRATTSDLEVGQGVGGLVTDLPLMIQAALPRYLVEGDSLDAVAVVSNRTESPRDVKVSMSVSPGELSTGQKEIAQLPPDAQERVVSRLTVEENVLGKVPLPEKLEFQVEARTAEGDNDAERISVPILPFGSAYGKSAGGLLKAGESQKIVITRPRGLLKPKAEIRISGSPLAVVEGALKYLADYPYGCVEQTMSRFMPTVVAAQAMSELGLSAKSREELTPMVEQGLARLYHYQHGDGGWGWWEHDETNPYLTAYVISGLVAAREAGYPVSENVLERGVRAAKNLLAALDPARARPSPATATPQEKNEAARQASIDRETRIYLAWALSRAGQAPTEELAHYTAQADQLGTYAVALLALSWQESGAMEKSLPLVSLLQERAKETGAGVFWPSRAATSYGWTDDDVESSALATRAILAARPDASSVAGAIPWLLSQREGAQWKSTRDTAQVVLALLDFARSQPGTREGTLQVRWDGQPLETVTLDQTEKVVTVPADLLVNAPNGGHRLELVSQGSPAVMSWKFSGFLKEAEKVDLPGESEGLRLTRTYVVEQPGQLLRHNRVTPPEILRLTAGQEVEVELEFELPYRMQYLKLEDPRPAGFEVVAKSHGGSVYPSRQEDRDAFSAFFFTSLPAGKHLVTYRLRAETPGDLRSLPARLELMYRPSVYGASPSQRVHVKRAGEEK